MLWEVLEGPGIRIPYAEYLDTIRIIAVKEGIKDGSVRPTLTTTYDDAIYGSVKELLRDCLQHQPELRPSAAAAHNRLCALLGRSDTVAESLTSQVKKRPELRQSMDVLTLLPQRHPQWTCSRCGNANFGQSACSNPKCLHERSLSSVLVITCGGGFLWIGLEDGQVEPNLFLVSIAVLTYFKGIADDIRR